MKSSTKYDLRDFSSLEKDLLLFERNYNGFNYWQSIRFFVCESLFGNRSDNRKKEIEERKRSAISYIKEILVAVIISIKELFRFISLKKVDLLFLRQDLGSDLFYDSWNLPDDISCINYRVAQYSKEHKPDDHFLEWPRIKTRISQRVTAKFGLYKKDKKEKVFLKKLENKLIDLYGQSMTADEMERWIIDSKIEEKHYYRAFKKIFDKTECKAIALECYYSNCFYPAYRIAKKKKIAIVEFQHGVINNHEEYWFEDDRGVNNYVPDYLLTFGAVHNEWIKLVKSQKAIAIGFPFQEKRLKELKDVIPDEKEIIIYPDSNPNFEEVIDEFANEIVQYGYRVTMKMHPLQMSNVSLYYPRLSLNKNINIVTSQKEGIYYWLKKAKHHIMASTTVGLEAVALDHTNVCIATNVPHDQVECLLEWKIARGFNSAEELKALIMDPIDMNNDLAKNARERLWKENASDNMTAFFEKLKNNNWA